MALSLTSGNHPDLLPNFLMVQKGKSGSCELQMVDCYSRFLEDFLDFVRFLFQQLLLALEISVSP